METKCEINLFVQTINLNHRAGFYPYGELRKYLAHTINSILFSLVTLVTLPTMLHSDISRRENNVVSEFEIYPLAFPALSAFSLIKMRKMQKVQPY